MLHQSKPERLPMLSFQASLMSVNKDNKDRSLSLEFDKIKLIKKWVWAKCSVENL